MFDLPSWVGPAARTLMASDLVNGKNPIVIVETLMNLQPPPTRSVLDRPAPLTDPPRPRQHQGPQSFPGGSRHTGADVREPARHC